MTYYDDRALVVQHRASTHLGGVEKDWYKLDFLGRRVSTRDSYSFTYNAVGRLRNAVYTDHDAASNAKFTETVGYDRNGNITTLQRYGRTGASTYGRIDYLALTYSGNRLSTVKDTGSAAYSNDFRYSNTTSTTYSYTYDAARVSIN